MPTELFPADPLSVAGFFTSARLRAFEKDGVRRVADLLLHLPFRHEDRSRFASIRSLAPGVAATICGSVLSSRLVRTRRRGFTITEAVVDDETGALRVAWYNRPYLARALGEGRSVILWGAPEIDRRGLLLLNPEAEFPEPGSESDPVHAHRVVGVYRKLGGVGTRTLRQYIHDLLEAVRPPFATASGNDRELLDALCRHHFPTRAPWDEELGAMRRVLAREEALAFALRVAQNRKKLKDRAAVRFTITDAGRERLRAILPFHLTGAQKKVLREIGTDLKSGHPMARLLQGDVGSGKTIVALLALLLAVENGYQGAFMAPTEILAEQHADRISRTLSQSPYCVALLTGRIRGRARRLLLKKLVEGEVNLLVGTHALIEADVQFKRLGLVVIDEQHRFGVAHRAALYRKAEVPHVLVMTATPIPRSLAWTIYGDLEVSVLEEKPPGRQEVRTVVRDTAARQGIYRFVGQRVGAGEQVYVIAPSIEEGPRETAAAETLFREVQGRLSGARVGLVHGRLPPAVRQERMTQFRAGEIDVLVATTVVEVGVDIPNATVLVIENAESFGLAQLHQLRGRVGRGPKPSWCILLAGEKVTPEGVERLQVLSETNDGFSIAETDLALRGPGELIGKRQAGLPDFKVFDPLRDLALFRRVRQEAATLVAAGSRVHSDLFPFGEGHRPSDG